MSRVEIESLESPTLVRYGGRAVSEFVVHRGDVVSFPAEAADDKPIVVDPGDVKGGGVILLAPDLSQLDTERLFERSVRVGGHRILHVEDLDTLDLDDVHGVAVRATSEGLTLRITVGASPEP